MDAGNQVGPTANIAVRLENNQPIQTDTTTNPERERVRVQANQTVIFDGSGSFPGSNPNITGYSWFIPEYAQGFPPEVTISVSFPNIGIYTLTLTVTDQAGLSGTKTIDVEVY